MRQHAPRKAFPDPGGFAEKVEHGHCSGGLSLRLRAFALALRGPPAISQIAVLSAVIDRRYSGRARHHAVFVQSTAPNANNNESRWRIIGIDRRGLSFRGTCRDS